MQEKIIENYVEFSIIQHNFLNNRKGRTWQPRRAVATVETLLIVYQSIAKFRRWPSIFKILIGYRDPYATSG